MRDYHGERPSPEEQRHEHRKFLAETGCKFCQESDPDRLDTEAPVTIDCPGIQMQPMEPVVICEDCEQDTITDRWLASVRGIHTHGGPLRGTVQYACDNWTHIEDELVENPLYDEDGFNPADAEPMVRESDLHPRLKEPITGPLRCPQCDAQVNQCLTIDEVLEE